MDSKGPLSPSDVFADSYHLYLSKQGTYLRCHLTAEGRYAREFLTVTQFLIYPCALTSVIIAIFGKSRMKKY